MASPPSCISCDIYDISKLRKLECDIHSKCMDCISKAHGSFFCEECNRHKPLPPEKVFVYMDNSNIWIEAKKLLRCDEKEDRRVRVDVGRLLKIVANKREVGEATLYGSEPPPLDTVWKEMKERGWNVKPQERSPITDKEKQIDTQMVTDVTKRVSKNRSENNVIIFISGDADIIPAVQAAIEEKWRVEVYMWNHAISTKLKKFGDKQNMCEICFLDDFQGQILFNSMKFPIAKNKKLLSIVRANGVVCKIRPDAFKSSKGTPSNKWCKTVEKNFNEKFRFFWMEELNTKTQKTIDNNLLVLVFTEVSESSYKIAEILKSQKQSLPVDVLEMVTYHAYECMNETSPISLNLTNSYSLPFDCSKLNNDILELIGLSDDLCDSQLSQSGFPTLCESDKHPTGATANDILKTGHNSEENHETLSIDHVIDDKEGDWTRVEYKRKTKKSKQLYSQRCENGLECKEGLTCHYKHTDEEKEAFKKRKVRPKLYKTRLCRHLQCSLPPSKCSFAHGEKDAICLKCKVKGHLTEKCNQH